MRPGERKQFSHTHLTGRDRNFGYMSPFKEWCHVLVNDLLKDLPGANQKFSVFFFSHFLSKLAQGHHTPFQVFLMYKD